MLQGIEARFPRLEEVGCAVGIGVATGADHVYIAPFDSLDVEDDRKLPLVMAADVRHGEVQRATRGVINPFTDAGGLVNLEDYPRLQAYLAQHEAAIRARSVAQRSPRNWFRTIDRITPSLMTTPKLLIPDLSGKPVIAYDPSPGFSDLPGGCVRWALPLLCGARWNCSGIGISSTGMLGT